MKIAASFFRVQIHIRAFVRQAHRAYAAAFALQPSSFDAATGAARTAAAAGDTAAASAFYSRAADVAPDDPFVHVTHGTLIASKACDEGVLRMSRLAFASR